MDGLGFLRRLDRSIERVRQRGEVAQCLREERVGAGPGGGVGPIERGWRVFDRACRGGRRGRGLRRYVCLLDRQLGAASTFMGLADRLFIIPCRQIIDLGTQGPEPAIASFAERAC